MTTRSTSPDPTAPVHLVMPADLAADTLADAYARRMAEALRAAGAGIMLHALPGPHPRVDPSAILAADVALSRLPDGAPVLLDGNALPNLAASLPAGDYALTGDVGEPGLAALGWLLSAYRFEPADAKTVRYGLGAIKGSGQSAIEEILRAREGKPFTDLFDFCARIDRRVVNRRTIEALIRAGAFDTIHENRAQLMASVPMAMEAAEQASAAANQVSLFDLGDESLQAPLELADEPAWTDKRKLQEEKQALGFYLSGHMFDSYAEEVRRFVRTRIRDLTDGRDKLVAGVISSMRTMMTQRGKMLIVQLDDGTSTLEVTIFNEQFEANKHLFKEDELLIVQGNARPDSFTGGLRFTTESVMDLGRARARFARALKLSFNGNADWTRLRATLQPHCTMYRVAATAGAGGGGSGGFNGGGVLRLGGIAPQDRGGAFRRQGRLRPATGFCD